MKEEQLDHILKTALEENAKTELSQDFNSVIKEKINKRKQTRIWKSLILQWALSLLAVSVGIVALLIVGVNNSIILPWLPHLAGLGALLILFQILEHILIKKGKILNH